MKKILNIYTILCLISVLVMGCQTEEGCLNPNSVNYNPGADKNCCCELPKLRLRTYTVQDTATFDFNQPLTDAGGNPFYIQDFKFYISKVSLIDASGNKVTIKDTTIFMLKDNSTTEVADQYNLIDESVFEYEVGYFDGLNTYTSLELELGLDALAQQIKLDELEQTHPLKDTLMYVESKDSLVSLKTNISLVNQQTLRVYETFFSQNLIVPVTLTPEIAFDIWVELNIDYEILFQNVDFINDNDNTIVNKIVSNMNQAIRSR